MELIKRNILPKVAVTVEELLQFNPQLSKPIASNRFFVAAPRKNISRIIYEQSVDYLVAIRAENDMRWLVAPLISFVLAAITTIMIGNGNFQTGPEEAVADINEGALETQSLDPLQPIVFKKRTSLTSSLSLDRIEKAALAIVQGNKAEDDIAKEKEAETALAKVDPSLLTQDGQVKFIAGMITVFRPTIPNCGLIAKHIVEISHDKGLDPLYVAAIISIESRFTETARSNVGATGLMQLMPGTAKEVAENMVGGRILPKLTDPKTNISLGIDYINFLEKRYSNNRYLALAAYNWGPGNVDNAIKNRKGFPRSVQQYAKTIMERSERWQKHFHTANKSASELGKDLS